MIAALALSITSVVYWSINGFTTKRGRMGLEGATGALGSTGTDSLVPGATGPTGAVGATGTSMSLSFAYATQLARNIAPGSAVSWNDGLVYPSTGITPPDLFETDFLIGITGIYEYDYRIFTLSDAQCNMVLQVNGIDVVGSQSASDPTATGFVNVNAHGTTSFNTNDVVTLFNVGPGGLESFGDQQKNASLRLIQIA